MIWIRNIDLGFRVYQNPSAGLSVNGATTWTYIYIYTHTDPHYGDNKKGMPKSWKPPYKFGIPYL